MRTEWMGRRGIIFLFAALMLLSCFSFSADAQVSTIPRTISYQGYLTNATGAPVNGTIEMVFSIFNVLSGGAPLWNETQTTVPVINGIYNVILGSVNEINLPFNTPYYLGMSIGGEELSPRKAITSVGYAFRAYTADVVPSHPHSGADITTGTVAEARIDPLIARTSALTPLIAHTANMNNPHGTTAAQAGAAPAVHDHAGVYVGVGQASSVTSAMIADGAVAAADLASSSVTKPKLSAAGGTAGQVLGTDGSNLVWQAPSTGMGWVDDGGYVRLATATDRVGIGKPDPAEELHVLGAGYLQAIFQSTDSSGGIQLVSGEPVPRTPGIIYELQARKDGGFIVHDRTNERTVLEALPNGTIQSYRWMQARNGLGDTISIGGDNVGNDLEISIYPTDDVKNTISFWNARTGIGARIGVGDITWSPKTRWLSVPAGAFRIDNKSEMIISETSLYVNATAMMMVGVYAPVFLPQGATVTKLTAYWEDADSDPDYDLRIFLTMKDMDTFASIDMARVDSFGAAVGIRSSETSSITNPVIDNGNFFYFLWVDIPANAGAGKLRGVRIEYTTTNP